MTRILLCAPVSVLLRCLFVGLSSRLLITANAFHARNHHRGGLGGPTIRHLSPPPVPAIYDPRQKSLVTPGYSALHPENIIGAWRPNQKMTGTYGTNAYWLRSPYFHYFRQVWGNAPFIDGNFRAWMAGQFKGYEKPTSINKIGQNTKALPGWLHYYDRKYDPIKDPPFDSEFSLFDAQKRLHGPIDKLEEDCSEGNYPHPCGERHAEYIKAMSKMAEELSGGVEGSGSGKDEASAAHTGSGSGSGPVSLEFARGKTQLGVWWSDEPAKGEVPAVMPKRPPPPPAIPPPPAYLIGPSELAANAKANDATATDST